MLLNRDALLVIVGLCIVSVSGAPQRQRNSNNNPQQPSPQFFQPAPQGQPQAQPAFPAAQQGFGPQPGQPRFPQQGGQPQGPPPQGPPQINWGQCPQLEPSTAEKQKKASVITKCLESTPIPANITTETVEVHREQVAACALQAEGWFNNQGHYRFDKAETEIKAKRLKADIEEKVISYHNQCKSEAEEKFPAASKALIPQIQLYQACMDYFISEACGIEVAVPQGFPQGPPPQQGQPQGTARFQ